jgi:hypothetical protein
MPASKAEQVLEAVKTLFETVLGATIERNSAVPEKIPAGRLLREGRRGSEHPVC